MLACRPCLLAFGEGRGRALHRAMRCPYAATWFGLRRWAAAPSTPTGVLREEQRALGRPYEGHA